MDELTIIPKPSKTVLIAGVIIAALFSVVLYRLLLIAHLSVLNWMTYAQLVFWAEVVFLWWYARQFENQPLIVWKEKQSGLKFILTWTALLFLLIVAANLVASLLATSLGFHINKEAMRQMSRFITGRYF